MVKTLYHEPKGTLHYNIRFKSGGLLTRLVASEICGLKPREIEWIYLVEKKRNATPDEIKKLCRQPTHVHKDWASDWH
jgi:hypothetical protein